MGTEPSKEERVWRAEPLPEAAVQAVPLPRPGTGPAFTLQALPLWGFGSSAENKGQPSGVTENYTDMQAGLQLELNLVQTSFSPLDEERVARPSDLECGLGTSSAGSVKPVRPRRSLRPCPRPHWGRICIILQDP